MNATLPDNPLGLDGFEFVEFTSPDPDAMADLFEKLGFVHAGNHRRIEVRHYVQGDVNFLLNMEPVGHADAFRKAHGPSASAMAFRVRDAREALKLAVERGAVQVEGAYGYPAIEGIGGSWLYLIDGYGKDSLYDSDFEPVAGSARKR